jgi:putative transposase
MPRIKYTVEQIIAKLREAEVALSQGQTVVQVSRSLGITEQTYYRWRNEYGGLKIDQARRLKDLERENTRLKRAVAELTLDKLILKEAAAGNFSAQLGDDSVCSRSLRSWALQNGGRVECWGSPAQPNGIPGSLSTMKRRSQPPSSGWRRTMDAMGIGGSPPCSI